MFIFDTGNDVTCPKCKSQWGIAWSTEYGDPLPGDDSKPCPKCHATISFYCDVVTTYTQPEVVTKTAENWED